jgi:hypothetical protein
MMLDRPLSKWREENRADAAAGEYQRKSKTSALVEHEGTVRAYANCAVPLATSPSTKKRETELPDVWSKPAERSERQREDEDRRQGDTPGWQAIEQKPYGWRNQSDGDRRESEGAADGFALPAKRIKRSLTIPVIHALRANTRRQP